jgi:hypothetical protein
MYFKITPEIERLIQEIFTEGGFITEADVVLAALRAYRQNQVASQSQDDEPLQLDAPPAVEYHEHSLRQFYNDILQDAQRRPSGPGRPDDHA